MARPNKNSTKQPKTIASTQSLSSFVKSICDIMRRSNCASALQFVPELTWIRRPRPSTSTPLCST
jgi:type I restriction enzyme M protein